MIIKVQNKQKIILFDGVDHVGKTSIAKELSKFLDIPYFKFVNHNYWDKNEYELATKFDQPFLAELLRQTNYSIILDRGYPAEFAYGTVYERNIDYDLIDRIDKMFADLNTTIIFCSKDNNREKDEKVTLDKYEKLSYAYGLFSSMTKCNKIFLNTTSQDVVIQLKTITERLKEIYND